jgi:hypothetical protein
VELVEILRGYPYKRSYILDYVSGFDAIQDAANQWGLTPIDGNHQLKPNEFLKGLNVSDPHLDGMCSLFHKFTHPKSQIIFKTQEDAIGYWDPAFEGFAGAWQNDGKPSYWSLMNAGNSWKDNAEYVGESYDEAWRWFYWTNEHCEWLGPEWDEHGSGGVGCNV